VLRPEHQCREVSQRELSLEAYCGWPCRILTFLLAGFSLGTTLNSKSTLWLPLCFRVYPLFGVAACDHLHYAECSCCGYCSCGSWWLEHVRTHLIWFWFMLPACNGIANLSLRWRLSVVRLIEPPPHWEDMAGESLLAPRAYLSLSCLCLFWVNFPAYPLKTCPFHCRATLLRTLSHCTECSLNSHQHQGTWTFDGAVGFSSRYLTAVPYHIKHKTIYWKNILAWRGGSSRNW